MLWQRAQVCGDIEAGLRQQFAGLLVREARLLMRIVAIRADGRVEVAASQRLLMDAVQHFVVLIRMAILAGGVELRASLATRLGLQGGVRKRADVRMAIHAGHVLLVVDAVLEGLLIDREGKRSRRWAMSSRHARLAVATQAVVIRRLVLEPRAAGLCAALAGEDESSHAASEQNQSRQ